MSHFERVLSVSDRLIIAYHSHRPDYRQLFHTAPEEGSMSVNDLIFYEMDCNCSNNFRLNILWPRQFYDHCLDHIKHSTRYAGREQRIYFDCDICHQKFTDSVYYLHHLAAVHVKHVVRCHRCGHHCDRAHLANNHIQKVIRCSLCGHECVRGPNARYEHVCRPHDKHRLFDRIWRDIDDE